MYVEDESDQKVVYRACGVRFEFWKEDLEEVEAFEEAVEPDLFFNK